MDIKSNENSTSVEDEEMKTRKREKRFRNKSTVDSDSLTSNAQLPTSNAVEGEPLEYEVECDYPICISTDKANCSMFSKRLSNGWELFFAPIEAGRHYLYWRRPVKGEKNHDNAN